MAEETKSSEPLTTEQPLITIKEEPLEEKKPEEEKKKPRKPISEKQKEALKKGRERRWKKEVSLKVQSEVETQLSSSSSESEPKSESLSESEEEELDSPSPSPPKLRKEKKFWKEKEQPETQGDVSDVSSDSEGYDGLSEDYDSQEDNVPEESKSGFDSEPEPDTHTRHRRESKVHPQQMKTEKAEKMPKKKKKSVKRRKIETDVDNYLMSFMPMFL